MIGMVGLGGVGSVVSNVAFAPKNTPISSIAKNVALDTAKSTALNTLYGNDSSFSIGDLIKRSKYKAVSDKKSGPIGYFAPGWYVEGYRIGTDCFIGNRKYNKARGVNLKWSMLNATDFEIGNYRNNNAKNGVYIAYNSDTSLFLIGDLKHYKLNGYCLELDEYYGTSSFVEYKKGKPTGYAIKMDDGTLNLYKDDELIGTYNEESDSFEMTKKSLFGKKQPTGIDIDFGDGWDEYIVKQDDQVYTISSNNYVEFMSDDCEFNGTAFEFKCKYNYNKKDEWVEYDYTMLTQIIVNCSDGAYGEVLRVSDEDTSEAANSMRALSEAIRRVGIQAVSDTIIDAVETGVPELKALDLMLELSTGEGFSDRITSTIENTLTTDSENDKSFTEKLTDTYDNLTNTDDYHDLGDKIKDGLGIETYEEKSEREARGRDEALHEAFEHPNEDGSYTLPSGAQIRIE